MKWSSHKLLTSKLLSIINYDFDTVFINGLFEGVIEPDKLPDYKVRVYTSKRVRTRIIPATQHDGINKLLVKYYSHLALYFYRHDDLFNAGRALGRAIHYVQDGVIKRTKWLFLDVHDKIEEEIDVLVRTKLSEMLDECIKIKKIKVSSNSREALCSAIKCTYDLLRWFVDELEKSINKNDLLRKIRRIRMMRYIIGSSMIGALLLILSISPVTAMLWSIITVITLSIVMSYRPKTYWEAFKAGILRLKPPSTYRTVM